MSEQGVQIFRLVMAGVNGLLFAIGLYIVIYQVRLKPRRWRRELTRLILEVEREERELEDTEEEDEETERELGEKREHIDRIRKALNGYFKDTRSIITIAFGGLMIAVALFALANLLFMPFGSFL